MIILGLNAYHADAAAANIMGFLSLYIVTFVRVAKPFLTGRIMAYPAGRFFYQWKPLERRFQKAAYG